MKAKSITFIAVFLFSMSIFPIYNTLVNKTHNPVGVDEFSIRSLYNIDAVLSISGAAGNLLGISTDADKVFFGRDHWLFLGNNFNKPISKKIVGASGYDSDIHKTITAMDGWAALSRSIGGKGFYVMIGPDKDSIYTDMLPGWYRKNNDTISQNLISGSNLYIDTPKYLMLAKNESALPLYFKTDTHWNELGAYEAFKGLISKSEMNGDNLQWPSEKLNFVSLGTSNGDLSRFQRSGVFLSDTDVRITSPSVANIPISVISYKSGKNIYAGLNESIESPREALLVRSPEALNNTKVLWLRDSFGTSMSRIMASTFSETLQIHHGRTSPEEIKKIMLNYKPDYVIVTVVERDDLGKMFSYNPSETN